MGNRPPLGVRFMSYPVADAAAFLRGSWVIDRDIVDSLCGAAGTFNELYRTSTKTNRTNRVFFKESAMKRNTWTIWNNAADPDFLITKSVTVSEGPSQCDKAQAMVDGASDLEPDVDQGATQSRPAFDQ